MSETLAWLFAWPLLAGLLVWRFKWQTVTNLAVGVPIAYLFIWCIFASELLIYREATSAYSNLVLFSCVALFAAMHLLGRRIPIRTPQLRMLPAEAVESLLLFLGILAWLGGLASIWTAHRNGFFELSAADARKLILNSEMTATRWEVYLFGYCTPMGFIPLAIFFLQGAAIGARARIGAYLSLGGLVLNCWATLSRHSLLLVIIICVTAFALCRLTGTKYKVHWSDKLLGGAALIFLLGYMFILPFFRIKAPDQSGEIFYAVNADPGIFMSDVVYHMPDVTFTSTAQISAYFSHQIVMLSRYLSSGPIGPYFGRYQFKWITAKLYPEGPDYGEIREELHFQSESIGLYGNIWGTAVRDAIVDFGVLGALAQFATFGLLSGWVHQRFVRTRSIGDMLLFVVLAGWAYYGVNVSAFIIGTFEMFSMMALGLWALGFRNTVMTLCSSGPLRTGVAAPDSRADA